MCGVQYGPINGKELLRDPKTVRKHIQRLANKERDELYPKVVAAANAEELSCSIDMWTEDSSKVSIMACNVVFPSFNSEKNQWEVETKIFFIEKFP